ncbi:MAG: hypothetical protein JWP62_1528, partial [Blastococcus sp.]|nr:hypothetical protein [Blastococcus sp.]
MVVQLGVQPTESEQVGVVAAFDEASSVDHQDIVRERPEPQVVADQDRRAPAHEG